jgi:monoamine oxidase
MRQSRRDFIRTVALATGAVVTGIRNGECEVVARAAVQTLALDFRRAHEYLRFSKALPAASLRRHVDVLIVGSGPAGLAAAWRLRKEGRSVLVIENEPVSGGTLRAGEWRGLQHPVGSTYFVKNRGEQKQFLNDIGVHPIETGEDALVVGVGDAVYDWWNPSNLKQLPFDKSDIEAFGRFREVLMAMVPPAYPFMVADARDIAQFDSISALEHVAGYNSDRLTRTIDLYCRSVLGAPIGQVSAYALLNFYAFEFGDNFSIPCWTLPGGLGAIAKAAEQKFGAESFTRALALRFENAAAGVKATCLLPDESAIDIEARAAIIAVPKRIARRLVPDLPSAQSEAMQRLRYAPYVTLTICARERLFATRAFDFWFDDRKDRFSDVIDVTFPADSVAKNADRSAGPFVYMLSSARHESEREKLTDERYLVSLAQQMAEALEEHVTATREKIEELRIMAWGHSLVIPTVNAGRELAPIIQMPHGQIYFAGPDNDIAPGFENAFDSGTRAANRVLESKR